MKKAWSAILVGLLLWPSVGRLGAEEPSVDYLRDIKPILAERCYSCHGSIRQRANLRLDTAAFMKQGGDSGSVIEPGHSEESLLIEAVVGFEDWRMPPEGEGEPLSEQEVGLLTAWIDAGAPAPEDEPPQTDPREHWAYQTPSRPEVPSVANAEWARNPIDAFLAYEHEKRGLSPSPPADRATLLRRLSLDLTGLAPTREELHAFVNDPAHDAYEKVVDRLLASPRYGERWGRHWMDIWRYSDWAGFGNEVRQSQPHIWRWRDWIVESLNADTGYDQMVVAMLAGDEAAPDDPDTLRATGYLVRNWFKFNRNVWLEDTVDHTAKAFLGLTLACARCHDHKYDPISQADYYRVRAFFEAHEIRTDRVPGQPDTTQDGLARVYDAHPDTPTYLFLRGNEKDPDENNPLAPGLPRIFGGDDLAIAPVSLPPTAYYPGLREYVRQETLGKAESEVAQATSALSEARQTADAARERMAKLAARLDTASEAEAQATLDRAVAHVALAEQTLMAAWAGLETVRARLAADEARFADPPDPKHATILAHVAGRAERYATFLKAQESLARAGLALADAQAALTPDEAQTQQAVTEAEAKRAEARQALEEAEANRGVVSSAYSSLTPIYPETSTGRRLALARWIASPDNPLTARVAVNHVWLRHFGEPLVGTVFDFGLNGQRPSHPELLDWLATEFIEQGWSLKSLHRLIVTSHAYRMRSWSAPDDPNLAADPQNVFLWRMNPRRMEAELVRDNVLHVAGNLDPTMGGPDLDHTAGLTTHRRSLYYRHAAEKQMPFLMVFDTANVNACYRRDESVVPQQALALANSSLALGQSRLLARSLTERAGPESDAEFVALAFEQILGRAPTADERTVCEQYLRTQAQRLADPDALTPFTEGEDNPIAPSDDPSLRARENLVHVLINHNDFVTIR